MVVLITHEESQAVMSAFLEAGHDAYSCDLKPASGKYPERHLQMDCFEAIEKIKPDFLGMHPECTRLTVAANKYYKPEYAERFPTIHQDRLTAVAHFFKCAMALEKVGMGYIENPVGIMSSLYRKADQSIQPYQFGEDASKRTCFWLKNLLLLTPTQLVEPRWIECPDGKPRPRWSNQTDRGDNKLAPSEDRASIRSKTFPGVAKAMAEQWGGIK